MKPHVTPIKQKEGLRVNQYLFTSESVSEGHPDKVADQISDAILDAYLAQDPNARVACETLVTTGLVVISGEITANVQRPPDLAEIARNVIRDIGYNHPAYRFDADSCGVILSVDRQSPDIAQGVDRENEIGAGDQGMMFGYATHETEQYMPLPITLAHAILQELASIRKEGRQMGYLRPDSKSQVTVRYDSEHHPVGIETIVISTQHDEFAGESAMQQQIRKDITTILLPRVLDRFDESIRSLFPADVDSILQVNPTGKFVIGGPHGDTGLTGRKIIVDTYGGKGSHGGGAFSGKDPSKVDRSAAYAVRHLAKNLVAAGVADEILVQVAYAIGVTYPVSIYVNTYGTAKVRGRNGRILSDMEIGHILREAIDLRPGQILSRLGLLAPIYRPTATYGHMGRAPYTENISTLKGTREVTFFPWEQLDMVNTIQQIFGMNTH